ncbi:MAG: SPOR domain-containing protein [Oceanicoccus sp.]
MTHDFAKKPKATKRKKKVVKKQTPGWVWLFIGIVAGVFVSFLGYLANITPEPAPEKIAQKVDEIREDVKKTVATKFDFYTLLPEREVIVPVEHEDVDSSPKQATIYILQAGSFRSSNDADRLRAQLILMGLEAKVEQVSVANGDLWHRVQVGPFGDRSRLSKARGILLDQGIDTLLLKRKAEG